jgi:hypothetical protein
MYSDLCQYIGVGTESANGGECLCGVAGGGKWRPRQWDLWWLVGRNVLTMERCAGGQLEDAGSYRTQLRMHGSAWWAW